MAQVRGMQSVGTVGDPESFLTLALRMAQVRGMQSAGTMSDPEPTSRNRELPEVTSRASVSASGGTASSPLCTLMTNVH